jgi:hypothetical protein
MTTNMTATKNIVLMGLPATGKTSFLAALWYLVQHSQIASSLRLEKLEGDSKYLNQISKAWAAYEPVPHTRIDSETVVSMLLKDVRTNQTLKLSFPDLSGESFTLQWTMRQFTQGYDAFLRSASGGILFISPLRYLKPIRIDQANPLIEEILGGQQTQEPLQDRSAPLKPWNPERTPTQVQLVELLQFISGRDYFDPPFRLAVVISAWDKPSQLNTSPVEWLANEFPLFHQFLSSNQKAFNTAIYGLSAQGGDYSQRGALVDKTPSDRIEVVGIGISNPHDLTEPLQWLMR